MQLALRFHIVGVATAISTKASELYFYIALSYQLTDQLKISLSPYHTFLILIAKPEESYLKALLLSDLSSCRYSISCIENLKATISPYVYHFTSRDFDAVQLSEEKS